MITMPNQLGVIITGCYYNRGMIYQLTWNSNGDELKWSTLRDDLIRRGRRPILMWITDDLRDELTTCQYPNVSNIRRD